VKRHWPSRVLGRRVNAVSCTRVIDRRRHLAENPRSTGVLGVSCALQDPHYASSACATFRSSA
jgi:hypothetical protein